MRALKCSSCPVLGLFTLPDILNMFQSLDLQLYWAYSWAVYSLCLSKCSCFSPHGASPYFSDMIYTNISLGAIKLNYTFIELTGLTHWCNLLLHRFICQLLVSLNSQKRKALTSWDPSSLYRDTTFRLICTSYFILVNKAICCLLKHWWLYFKN